MIGEVTSRLSNLSVTQTTCNEVVKVVGFAPDILGTEIDALIQAFQPFIIASEYLEIARTMHPVRFAHVMPGVLFDEAEAKAVACVASSLLAQHTDLVHKSVSKKESGILWKVTVSDNAVVLLPKKNLFPDLTGGNIKRGRISLVCHKENTTWKTTLCWNLTSIKKKPAAFSQARKVENELANRGLSQFFAKLHHDFTLNQLEKRSAYYDLYQNLECWMLQTHPLKTRHNVLLQIAEIVQAFHEKGVLVIDLKPSNILVTKENKVLFCDPDHVLFLNTIQGEMRDNNDGGTPAYFPPELVTHGHAYGKSADVFAFGCIIFELCFAQLPWVTNQKRNIDTAVLDKYKKAAYKAKNVLEWPKEDQQYSLEDTLFKLSNWAMNTRGDARPTIETCVKLLKSDTFVEEPMAKGLLDEYLSYELHVPTQVKTPVVSTEAE